MQRFDEPQLMQRDHLARIGQEIFGRQTQDGSGGHARLDGIHDNHLAAIGQQIDQVGAGRASVGSFHAGGKFLAAQRFDHPHSHAFVAQEDVADAQDQHGLHARFPFASARDDESSLFAAGTGSGGPSTPGRDRTNAPHAATRSAEPDSPPACRPAPARSAPAGCCRPGATRSRPWA